MSEEKDEVGESGLGDTGQILTAAALGANAATGIAVSAGLAGAGLGVAIAATGIGAVVGLALYGLANGAGEWGSDGSAGAS